MHFNTHYAQIGKHATFGASNWHWLNYDAEKLKTVYENMEAKAYGTRLHAFAAEAISLGQKLPRSKKTINAYVNDAISHRMQAEQILYFSDNFFGTADAISFKDNVLRIHDLKTGKIPAHIEQLEIYAALFCLEYRIKPYDISVILRIYQNDEIVEYEPEAEEISHICNKIVEFDKILNNMREEV
jgi:hypothetical protein